jgi:hypothetical protein
MVEMRWYVPVTGDKVLQYRNMVNTTVYAGTPTVEEKMRTANLQWSPWKDVPMESERNPDFP